MDTNNESFLSIDSGINTEFEDDESNLETLCEWIDDAFAKYSNEDNRKANDNEYLKLNNSCSSNTFKCKKKTKRLFILLCILKKNTKLLMHYKKIVYKQELKILKIKNEKVFVIEEKKSESFSVHFFRFIILFIFFYLFAPIKIFAIFLI